MIFSLCYGFYFFFIIFFILCCCYIFSPLISCNLFQTVLNNMHALVHIIAVACLPTVLKVDHVCATRVILS